MRFMAVLLLFALAGCQTATLDTPSSRPEVTIAAPAASVRAAIVNDALNKGFSIVTDSPGTLVMDQPTKNKTTAALIDFSMRDRISFAFVEVDGKTRIVADVAVIGHPGTAREEPYPGLIGNKPQEAQAWLLEIKAKAEAAATK